MMVAAPRALDGRGAVDGPLVVAGFFSLGSGLGEAARATHAALAAVGVDAAAVDITPAFAAPDLEDVTGMKAMPKADTGTLVLVANPPEMPDALRFLGLRRNQCWRVIGSWAWELPDPPPGWSRAAPITSEVWAPSGFAASAIADGLPAGPPVFAMGLPVVRPDGIGGQPSPTAPFTVLIMADGLSSLFRKNVLGAIEAFRRAFRDDPGAKVIVKTRNLDSARSGGAAVRAALAPLPNAILIDRTLPTRDRWQLMADASVGLSLHRAEGFGYFAAEMSSIGRPVVVTDWSGTTDFVSPVNGVPIRYGLVPVDDPSGVYRSGRSRWAEPDVDEAVRALRKLRSDETLRRNLGAGGRAVWDARLSPAIVGRRMAAQLGTRGSEDARLKPLGSSTPPDKR